MTSTKGAILAIEETMAASEALREHLKQGERIGRKMVSALEQGTPISEAVEAAGKHPAELRQTSQDLLGNYESRSHRMCEFFMLASLDEGLSIGEIARKLGVSRQLADPRSQRVVVGSTESVWMNAHTGCSTPPHTS